MEYYDCLIDKYAGKTAFVCGAGLTFQDAIQHPLFARMQDHVILSVNSSILAFDWFKEFNPNHIWISNDSAVRNWTYWANVERAKAIRVVRTSWEKYFDEIPDFYLFEVRGSEFFYSDRKLVGVSSVPSAIDLALQMGCVKIFLLGVDHYGEKGKTHFWELWEEDKRPKTSGFKAPLHMQQKIFNMNQNAYRDLRNFADHKKAVIYNCNLKSAVRSFEKITLDNAIEELDGKERTDFG